jgi:hypothetical protein
VRRKIAPPRLTDARIERCIQAALGALRKAAGGRVDEDAARMSIVEAVGELRYRNATLRGLPGRPKTDHTERVAWYAFMVWFRHTDAKVTYSHDAITGRSFGSFITLCRAISLAAGLRLKAETYGSKIKRIRRNPAMKALLELPAKKPLCVSEDQIRQSPAVQLLGLLSKPQHPTPRTARRNGRTRSPT